MLVIDSHLDLSWNALQWNRDLRLSAHRIREMEASVSGPGRGRGTVSFPELRRGRVALCFATLLARSTGHPEPHLDYSSPAQAFGAARGQLAYYQALTRQGQARLVTNCAELEHHIAEWQAWESAPRQETPPLGFVISMESADPILDANELSDWKKAGVRVIGPAHYGPGRYAGGTGAEVGLTPEGASLLREMARLGILLDVTHLSDRAFWEALDLYDGQVLASHNNCRALVPNQRQLSDEQIQALVSRRAVIGVALDAWMLNPAWVRGADDNLPVYLADAVSHIDHICQLAGNSHHAALGSDLDGGFGREQSPSDLDTIADLQRIPEILAGRGYSDDDIIAIMHGNWLRLLRESWQAHEEADNAD
jgi:membrane dipeptidase